MPILSLFVAIYFLWAFHLHVGFPPRTPLTSTSVAYLAMFVFFVVLPFAQRVKIGRFVDYRAKVERVEAEVKDVRAENRELISVVSNWVSAISTSINQSVVVNVPNYDEVRKAREELSEDLGQPTEPSRVQNEVEEYFAREPDLHYVLARLRMDLEWELRSVLRNRLESESSSIRRGKYFSLRDLFRRLVSANDRYKSWERSFNQIISTCNAAVHGQPIREDIAYEVIDMGLQMLRDLKNTDPL